MELVEIPAQEVRLSSRATAALASNRPVAVTRYGRRSHVVLNAHQFELVAPLLELLEEAVLAAEVLMSKDDLELERLLAEDREPSPSEEALIEELLAEASVS